MKMLRDLAQELNVSPTGLQKCLEWYARNAILFSAQCAGGRSVLLRGKRVKSGFTVLINSSENNLRANRARCSSKSILQIQGLRTWSRRLDCQRRLECLKSSEPFESLRAHLISPQAPRSCLDCIPPFPRQASLCPDRDLFHTQRHPD